MPFAAIAAPGIPWPSYGLASQVRFACLPLMASQIHFYSINEPLQSYNVNRIRDVPRVVHAPHASVRIRSAATVHASTLE